MRSVLWYLLLVSPIALSAQVKDDATQQVSPPAMSDRCSDFYNPSSHTMTIRKRFDNVDSDANPRENIVQHVVWSNGSRAEHHGAYSKLYDVPNQTTTIVDHAKRRYLRMGGSSDGRPQWVRDNQHCTCAARHYWFRNWRFDGEVYRGAHRLARWTGFDGNGHYNEVYFGPQVHCLEMYRVTKDVQGRKVFEKEIISLNWGERSEDLFRVPGDYIRVRSFSPPPKAAPAKPLAP